MLSQGCPGGPIMACGSGRLHFVKKVAGDLAQEKLTWNLSTPYDIYIFWCQLFKLFFFTVLHIPY